MSFRNSFPHSTTRWDSLAPEWLQTYSLYYTQTLKLSENTIHSRLNAVKFYFENRWLHCEKLFFEEIPRPKKASSLLKVTGKTNIAQIFSTVNSINL
ncbi:MAG: hypothetical protein LBI42_14110 [Chitinispirillales bacterium]|nr:hypothetical protein [Chitinispirillales bacterium]